LGEARVVIVADSDAGFWCETREPFAADPVISAFSFVSMEVDIPSEAQVSMEGEFEREDMLCCGLSLVGRCGGFAKEIQE
jgi:hypothetical protein